MEIKANLNWPRRVTHPPSGPRFGLGGDLFTERQKLGSVPELSEGLNHCTMIMRERQLWERLVDRLDQLYPQGTTIKMFGCATGAEANTLAMMLHLKLGSEKAKRFPIEARDLSPSAVDIARLNLISDVEYKKLSDLFGQDQVQQWVSPISNTDIKKQTSAETFKSIQEIAGSHEWFYYIYLRPLSALETEGPRKDLQYYQFKPQYTEQIRYDVGNICQAFKAPETQPSVVIFRNAWYHLLPKARKLLAHDLATHLHPNSLMVIGDCERRHTSENTYKARAAIQLQNRGFQPLANYNARLRYDDQDPGIKIFQAPKLLGSDGEKHNLKPE